MCFSLPFCLLFHARRCGLLPCLRCLQFSCQQAFDLAFAVVSAPQPLLLVEHQHGLRIRSLPFNHGPEQLCRWRRCFRLSQLFFCAPTHLLPLSVCLPLLFQLTGGLRLLCRQLACPDALRHPLGLRLASRKPIPGRVFAFSCHIVGYGFSERCHQLSLRG